MSDRDDPSPYAPPAVSSYPERLQRGPAMEDDRRLSWRWWLLPAVGCAIAPFLPMWSAVGFQYPIGLKYPVLLASLAIGCGIGAINCFRQSQVARQDNDILRETWRGLLCVVAASVAVILFIFAALNCLPLIP